MSQPGGGWPACYNYFFGQLTGVINAGSGRWKAKCPAHEDKVQSLSVRVGAKDQLYVRCHAGGMCSLSAIVRACGCELDDLFPDNKRYTQKGGKKHMDRTETVYQYVDENGALLFEAVRKEPKKFSQRRPNPSFNPTMPKDRESNPEYLYNMDGVRRVLFNLPVLLASLARTPDKAVFVVEGEKDVETARAGGIVATTNPMGAGKWSAEYAAFLKGANVVVIPDNDEPGKAHAKAVCESLKTVARTVRLVELPGLCDKEDFTDWWQKIARGSTDNKKAELKALVSKAKLYGGTGTTTTPIVPQSGATPETKPMAPAEDPKPAEKTPEKPSEPPKESPVPPTDAVGTSAEQFPSSPTIRGAAGLPNPAPGIVPDHMKAATDKFRENFPDLAAKAEAEAAKKRAAAEPQPVPLEAPAVEPQPDPPKPGPIPADRAQRVATFIKDAKSAATALKVAGFKCATPTEWYGAMRMAVSMMDQTFTLANGAPKLDTQAMGQIALMMGGYLLQAAADFGLGCGIVPDPAPTEPQK